MSSVPSLWRSAALGLALASVAASATYGAQAVVQPIPGTTDADQLGDQMRALAANPRDVAALIRAGELSLKLDDLSGAASLFARAEQVDPHNARLKAGEASVLVRSERPGQALRYFGLAQSYGLDAREFAGDRGLAFDLVGEQERAQRDYRLALKSGANAEVARRYALSLGISGKRDEALAVLDPLLRDTDRGAWRARAFVLAMAGDVAGAERIATTMMPPGMAEGLQPFFQRLPSLPAVDRAFAVHFGETRATAERFADARLVPALPPLGADPDAPALAARAIPARPEPPRTDRRDRRKAKEKPARVELAVTRDPTPALPAPPAYRGQPIPTVAPADPRVVPMNATARANAQALASLTGATLAPASSPTPMASRPARNRRVTLAAAGPVRMPAPMPTPRPTPTPTPMPMPAFTPSPTSTSTAPPMPTSTPMPTPTAIPTPTRTPVPLMTLAPPVVATARSSPLPAPAPAPAPAATLTPTAKPTPTPTTAVSVASGTAPPTASPVAAPPTETRVAVSGIGASVAAPIPSASPAGVPRSTPPAAALASASVAPLASSPVPGFSTADGSPPLPGTAAVAPPGFSIEQAAADRPVPSALASRQDDSILARIVAGLSIPAAELGVPDMPGTKTAADATLVEEAKAKEARDAAASKLLADKAAAEKVAAEKRAAERKAAADKRALADKKLAEATKIADAKAAADERKAARANPSRIWVQVAGGASAGDLPKAWAAAKAKAPKAFAGKQGWWTRLRATNRVLAGPFESDDDAREFVNALAKEGVSAFPFTSDKGQDITRLPTK